MDLVLDIGNHAAKGALFAEDALQQTFRLDLDPATASVDDWGRGLQRAVKTPPRRVGLSSVVPHATKRVRAALRDCWELDVFSVGAAEAHLLPFALGYRTPTTLGADRLAAATAAWICYGAKPGRSVLALDAGTALTYEVVRAQPNGGRYEGGAIAPGPALLRRALTAGTAQLPSVPLEPPPSPLGATTREALQSGLVYGLLDSVDGMLHRLSATLEGGAPLVVGTGGWSAFLYEHLDRIDHHAPHLVLHGVHLLLRKAESSPAERNAQEKKS